ncbi:MAG: hypothetical protein GXY38_06245 [Planctomycetes bacterium]|jgi:hypothetical protein|nr:hypothetical protein [Planctomycetota bacterium]
MASYKLNIARIRGLPSASAVLDALNDFGVPEDEEFGVLNASGTSTAVMATVIRRTRQAVQQLDNETHELTCAGVEKVTALPLAAVPGKELLELYAGSPAGIEQIGVFFSGSLALPTVVEAVEVDVPAAIESLTQQKKFQLVTVRVSDFAHNSFMIGPYAPKFQDTRHGMDFIEKYLAGVTSATVKFVGPTGRVTLTVAPNACFRYSCHEDDTPNVQALLRGLAGM